jgi:hypothetical protein
MGTIQVRRIHALLSGQEETVRILDHPDVSGENRRGRVGRPPGTFQGSPDRPDAGQLSGLLWHRFEVPTT